jgi:hypothetical protein
MPPHSSDATTEDPQPPLTLSGPSQQHQQSLPALQSATLEVRRSEHCRHGNGDAAADFSSNKCRKIDSQAGGADSNKRCSNQECRLSRKAAEERQVISKSFITERLMLQAATAIRQLEHDHAANAHAKRAGIQQCKAGCIVVHGKH